MEIIIAGAGIGGLITALRLHHEGVGCSIYEQSDQIRELGVGINLLPHAVKQLAAVGLLDRLDETGIRTRETHYAHRLGQPILSAPCGTAAGFTVPQFSIHRGRLQAVLLHAVRERLGPGAVRTGHRLTGFDQDADSVHAQFADPHGSTVAEVHGDVLIGADGIHSAVRAQLFPREGPPHWSGLTMWRGAADWPAFGTGRTMVVAGGASARFVVYPIADGSTPGTKLTNWLICRRTGRAGDPAPNRQDWSQRVAPAELTRHVELFHLPQVDHAGLVAASEEPLIFPMCDREPLPVWSHGRVTLLGDAAHPMYPMGANGAGQTALDAVSLAGNLARHADPVEALRAYQSDRLPAANEVVLRNRQGGPERVIDIVERRAPDGFTNLNDIVDPAELQAVVSGYAHAAGAAQEQVNQR
ncbi:MAG: flavin-dependent oxidoreductase [Labedaea sp.]